MPKMATYGVIQAFREAGKKVGGKEGVAFFSFDADRPSSKWSLKASLTPMQSVTLCMGRRRFSGAFKSLKAANAAPKENVG